MTDKLMDEIFETTQNIVKRMANCISKLTQLKSEKNVYKERNRPRLFSDLYKNLTKCDMNYEWKK